VLIAQSVVHNAAPTALQLQFPHNLAEQNAATAHSSAAAMPQHFPEPSLGQLRIRRQLRNFFLHFTLQLLIHGFSWRLLPVKQYRCL
jgi:hypothetical protein